jgi:hypothetical protein
MGSEAIRGHQRQSEAIRGKQMGSEAIRGHQRPSEAIRAPASPGTGRSGRRPARTRSVSRARPTGSQGCGSPRHPPATSPRCPACTSSAPRLSGAPNEGGHQRSSASIRCNQGDDQGTIRGTISGHQRSGLPLPPSGPSEAIRGHQRPSEAISGHQRSGLPLPPDARSNQIEPWSFETRALMREAINCVIRRNQDEPLSFETRAAAPRRPSACARSTAPTAARSTTTHPSRGGRRRRLARCC